MKDKRVGKFINRKYLDFTQEEIDTIVKNLTMQFDSLNVRNPFDIVKFGKWEIRKENWKSIGEYIALVVTFNMSTMQGRDSEGARLTMRGISFALHKNEGDIEIDFDKQIYEPFNGVVYSGIIHFDADWIGYKCRTRQSYQKLCPFKYGDELSDLDWSDVIERFCRDLRYCTVAG